MPETPAALDFTITVNGVGVSRAGEQIAAAEKAREEAVAECERLRDENEDLRRRNDIAYTRGSSVGYAACHLHVVSRERELRRDAERAAARAEARMVGMANDSRAREDATFERGVVAGRDALRQCIRTVLKDPFHVVGSPPWSQSVFEGDRYVAWFGSPFGNDMAVYELNTLRDRLLHAIDPHGEDA